MSNAKFMAVFRRPSINTVKAIATDLLAGTGYADVFVIGDSNAGNFDDATARGWSGGFWDALAQNRSVNEYGTGLYETAAASATNIKNGAPYDANEYAVGAIQTGTSYGTAWSRNFNGTTERTSLLSSIWKRGLKYPGVNKDFAYLESTSTQAYNSASWLSLNHNSSIATQISCQHAVTARWLYVGGTSQTNARATIWAYKTAGGDVSASSNTDVHNSTASAVIQRVSRSIAADASRTKYLATYGANTTGRGPLACIMRHIFRSGVPGFSVTNLHTHDGGTCQNIADALSESTGCGVATLQTYFQEAVTRQIDAGAAAGRVLVFISMGINDGTTNSATNYPTHVASIISQLKTAWSNAGYAPGGLGIVCVASHPTATYDPTDTNTAGAAAVAGDSQVRFVNLASLGVTTSYLTSNSYYSGVTTAHMNRSGYRAVSDLILTAVTT